MLPYRSVTRTEAFATFWVVDTRDTVPDTASPSLSSGVTRMWGGVRDMTFTCLGLPTGHSHCRCSTVSGVKLASKPFVVCPLVIFSPFAMTFVAGSIRSVGSSMLRSSIVRE